MSCVLFILITLFCSVGAMNPNVEDEEGFCDANASMAPPLHGQFPVPLLTSNIEIPFFSGKANEDFDKWFRDFKE